jgi:hypothetical protein
VPLPAAFITAACPSCRLPLSVVPGSAPSAADEADDGEAGGVSGGEDVPSVDMFLISMDYGEQGKSGGAALPQRLIVLAPKFAQFHP